MTCCTDLHLHEQQGTGCKGTPSLQPELKFRDLQVADGLTCAAWGPDGSALAMAVEVRLLVWHAEGHQLEASITSRVRSHV